ncbi:hypothetical protein FGB62_231g012 [Gracilaria domingensis]|nr:hypothetical protein FGB62_231g012 [Gracilaria domingensis]
MVLRKTHRTSAAAEHGARVAAIGGGENCAHLRHGAQEACDGGGPYPTAVTKLQHGVHLRVRASESRSGVKVVKRVRRLDGVMVEAERVGNGTRVVGTLRVGVGRSGRQRDGEAHVVIDWGQVGAQHQRGLMAQYLVEKESVEKLTEQGGGQFAAVAVVDGDEERGELLVLLDDHLVLHGAAVQKVGVMVLTYIDGQVGQVYRLRRRRDGGHGGAARRQQAHGGERKQRQATDVARRGRVGTAWERQARPGGQGGRRGRAAWAGGVGGDVRKKKCASTSPQRYASRRRGAQAVCEGRARALPQRAACWRNAAQRARQPSRARAPRARADSRRPRAALFSQIGGCGADARARPA